MDGLVNAINDFFRLDDLPFFLTPFSRETREVTMDFCGGESQFKERVIVARPQVIRNEDEVVHEQAIEPTLALLRGTGFTAANSEFLAALADYRKGDFGDCLTKCGSAFESVMKVICDQKAIPYDPQKDTASPLIKKLLAQSRGLENYFEQPLTIIATLRNKLSNSHGGGTQERSVPPHVAKYAINATAAAILLLVEEFAP